MDPFPPSSEAGVVVAARGGMTPEAAEQVGPIFADAPAVAGGLRTLASVKTDWKWFGTKFFIPQPYGALVGIGIKLQLSAVKSNLGTDGVRLRVFGPLSASPRAYPADFMGTSTRPGSSIATNASGLRTPSISIRVPASRTSAAPSAPPRRAP